MSKKNKSEKSDKSEKAEKPKTERANWNGFVATQVIRFCGAKGYTKNQAAAVIKHCGLQAADATYHIQLGQGRKNENVPELSGKQEKELVGIAKSVPAEKEKSSKKDKKGKKSKKTRVRESDGDEKPAKEAAEEPADDEEDDDEPDPDEADEADDDEE